MSAARPPWWPSAEQKARADAAHERILAERGKLDERERECPGHLCDDDAERYPHAGIGDVYYCDGSCRGGA